MVRIGRPQEQVLTLSEIEREELDRLGRSQTASHSLVRRSQIILASAAGEANTSIATRLGVSNPTICHWRKIWIEKGLTGLYGEARSVRPRTHDEERIASLLRKVLESKPVGATHWSVRSAATQTGLSKSTVARMLVNGIVVEDYLDDLADGYLRLNGVQKTDELLVPMAPHGAPTMICREGQGAH